MADLEPIRVRSTVRVIAGLLGIGFVGCAVALLVIFAPLMIRAEPEVGRGFAFMMTMVGLIMLATIVPLFLSAAWTGVEPMWFGDDDDSPAA
jgi:hypothetical protein